MPVFRKILAKKVKLTLKIKYKTSLRNIDENNQEVICVKENYKNRHVKFHCEFKPEKKEIEKIEIDEDFDFVGQEVNIKACSPLAVKNMKNLLKVGKNPIFNQKLFILESAEKYIKEKYINIIGKINDKSFSGDKIVLRIVTSDKEIEKHIDCSVETIRAKYKLVCEPKEDIDCELDGAIGKLEDENLIINFKKVKDSSVDFKYEKNEEIKDENNKKKSKKFSKKEKVTAPSISSKVSKEDNTDNNELENEGNSIQIIIYIVIGLIALLIIIILYIIICKPKNNEVNERHSEESSSIEDRYSSRSSSEIK